MDAMDSLRIRNKLADALELLKIIEEAAEEKDLPFVVSAAELIRDAIEREVI
jgi:hypothetical protein